MTDLKILRQMIKDSIDREQTAHILTGLGYQVGRDWKFALREDERTPSASIRQDGLITDFGDGWSGDIVALLHEKRSLSLKDATLFICEQMGISTDESYEYVPLPVNRKPQLQAELTDERHRQIVSTIGKFDRSDKQTFKDVGYKKSALSIAPMWVYKQAQNVDIQLFREFTTYDEVEQSIVLKIRNNISKLISYKHRYKGSIKWCTASGTHPNKQCLVSIPNPKDQLFPIYVCEGVRDFLMMVLLGLNVVAVPTVSYSEWTQRELSIFTGENIVLIPDIDEHNKGVECMANLSSQINDVAKSVKVVDIRKVLDLVDIGYTDTKMDFSDVVLLWVRTLEDFRNTLLYAGYIGVTIPNGGAF